MGRFYLAIWTEKKTKQLPGGWIEKRQMLN